MKIFFIASVFIIFTHFIIAQNNDELAGRRAPNFVLENLDGDYIELSKEIGEGPILLSFWATWCKPCLEELTELKELYKTYKDKGFKIIAISTDNEKTVAKVKPVVNSKGFDFPVVYDTNSEIARIYYAQQVPFSVLIDRNGAIVYSHLGYMRGDEIVISNKVKEMMAD